MAADEGVKAARAAYREARDAEQNAARNYYARRRGGKMLAINKARNEWALFALDRIHKLIQLSEAEDDACVVPATLGQLVDDMPPHMS
jgi:hypothetical protein